ncbi:MAG: hydantoinase/oxoprolinase family protein, partial [Planctomycetota bacterium]
VGAGGGSLAHFDALGALRVGPQSAGADPGPACYGTGERPTVTDAHLVLGHLSEEDALAGSLRLDRARAERAVGVHAEGILRVANATMERAIRTVTVRRGVDPRLCALIAFGGAGGLHACALAEALGMRTVLLPNDPGTFSAHGMRRADRRRDYVRTVLQPADACVARLEHEFALFPEAGERTADVRYVGQSHELAVTADADLIERFHAAHERAYGYADRTRAVEVVNLRVAAVERGEPVPSLPAPPRADAKAAPPRVARGAITRALLGPTVITETTATTVVPAGWRIDPLADGTLRLEVIA